jgi:hypothetical protein
MGLKSSATSVIRQITRPGSFRASVAGLWRIIVSLTFFSKIHPIPENPSLISRTISRPFLPFLLKLLLGSLRIIMAPSPIRATKTNSVSCSGTPVPFNIEQASIFPSLRQEKFIPLKKRFFVFFFNRFFMGHFKTTSISPFPTRLRRLIPYYLLNHKSNHQIKYFISILGFFIQVEDREPFYLTPGAVILSV